MYFPILRGKQYELLALRDISTIISTTDKFSPIIEPVKKDIRGLRTACNKLIENDINFTLIINPKVGEIPPPIELIGFLEKQEEESPSENFQIGIHCTNELTVKSLIQLLEKSALRDKAITLIHDESLKTDFIQEILDTNNVKYNLYNANSPRSRRFKRLLSEGSRVSLEDHFISLSRNVDYKNNPDEFFSDEYLYYKEEGNIGFGDYLTIGSQFIDSGFLPYAVVIHLTYESENEIRIRHFVSDTNDDYSDVPGKFAEALEKLVEFVNDLDYTTFAIDEFQHLYNTGHYPGLGSIKKLSILNHLELVNRLIS